MSKSNSFPTTLVENLRKTKCDVESKYAIQNGASC